MISSVQKGTESSVRLPKLIIEHVEVDFPRNGWCAIEYDNIARMVGAKNIVVTKCDRQHAENLPVSLQRCAGITPRSITEYLKEQDQAESSNPEGDATQGESKSGPDTFRMTPTGERLLSDLKEAIKPDPATGECRICFLDAHATQELSPEDIHKFDYFIVGGILGDHPPRDRGGYLRQHGFAIRHLGPRQMSTDTAVRTAWTIFRHQVPLAQLRFIDDPEVYKHQVDTHIKQKQDQDQENRKKKKKKSKKRSNEYDESTRIRMRYMTQYQPLLKYYPDRIQSDEFDDESATKASGTEFHNPVMHLWHPAAWETVKQASEALPSPPAVRAKPEVITSSTSAETENAGAASEDDEDQAFKHLPEMTPGLLEFIFADQDNPLDGILDLDFGGDGGDQVFDEQDQRALAKLFDFEE